MLDAGAQVCSLVCGLFLYLYCNLDRPRVSGSRGFCGLHRSTEMLIAWVIYIIEIEVCINKISPNL